MAVGALIIDDSPFARKVIRHHLVKLGFKVVGEAETAAQGLQLFRDLKPGLVTLDILMPERNAITSLDAFRAMRAEGSDTAILVVSALPFEKTRDTFLQEGALGYVVKPFSRISFEPVRQKLMRILPQSVV